MKMLGLNAMEIAGLVVIAVASIMQISAVATLKWQTYEKTTFGRTYSVDYGLFSGCTSIVGRETCFSTSADNKHKAEYNAVKATAILSILDMLGLIAAILVYKLIWKKSTLIPTIIMGIIAAIFGFITVIVYATAIDYPHTLLELGASFYVSCVAVVLYMVGAIIHGIGAKNSE